MSHAHAAKRTTLHHVGTLPKQVLRGLRGPQHGDRGMFVAVEPVHHVLHDLRVASTLVRPHRFAARQLGGLQGAVHPDATHLPGGCPLVQARVVAVTTPPHDALQRPVLFGSGDALVRAGRAHALLVQTVRFCRSGGQSALRRFSRGPGGPPGLHPHT
jgi:hypothetical protein